MPRTMLTDEHWTKLKPILREVNIYYKPWLRITLEGILYKLRAGCPWRDLPKEFGSWNSVYKRFREWSKKEKILKIFRILSGNPDNEWAFVDGSIVKAHQHSAGAAHGAETAIGKNVAGNTTKMHVAVESMGLPVEFIITGGEVQECKVAPELVQKLADFEHIVGDRGYDSKALREQISDLESTQLFQEKKTHWWVMGIWIGGFISIVILLKTLLLA